MSGEDGARTSENGHELRCAINSTEVVRLERRMSGHQPSQFIEHLRLAGHLKPAEASLMYYPATRSISAEARLRVR